MLFFLYAVASRDVINFKNVHEILRYCFYILATPQFILSQILFRRILAI